MALSGRHLETRKKHLGVIGIEKVVKTMGGDKIAKETEKRRGPKNRISKEKSEKLLEENHSGVGG